ncbi:response regulator transcription factor [Neorhizobium petrolearium]|uniref:Response regulator transcription factor n=1 Tax=Neorhizobium petrolearium TaxID=515361 RepID=A0ABY8MC21_9HYPH|nr:response regulator transcription factor [Neorhizobium petrolearium]MCC2610886.1 response regulator transcription factor [Neorhizobium petrolearium]WGI71000.1 response regulator transcription factor [Neorhizobium petrolearium]
MQVSHTVSQHAGVDLTGSLSTMNAARTLLFICAPGTISTAMIAAIESEFPWLSVKTVSDLQSALIELDISVQLVLADTVFAPALREHWPKLARLHHNVSLALIGNGDDITSSEFGMQGTDIIQGIVPFNVNLDVFLSILRIILKGGRYFPSRFPLSQQDAPLEKSRDGSETQFRQQISSVSPVRMLDRLTKREREILARIAMGNQNKIIAATLGLSEHTVKIHIHNIITKLGLHNRTEVVALYFEQRRKDTAGNAHDPNRRQGGGKRSDNE